MPDRSINFFGLESNSFFELNILSTPLSELYPKNGQIQGNHLKNKSAPKKRVLLNKLVNPLLCK